MVEFQNKRDGLIKAYMKQLHETPFTPVLRDENGDEMKSVSDKTPHSLRFCFEPPPVPRELIQDEKFKELFRTTVKSLINEHIKSASNLHWAHGGSGLKIDQMSISRGDAPKVHLFIDGAPNISTEFILREELFAKRSEAQDVLAEVGLHIFEAYSSIDLLHQENGLEICGIKDEPTAIAVKRTLQKMFSELKLGRHFYKDTGADIGWKVVVTEK